MRYEEDFDAGLRPAEIEVHGMTVHLQGHDDWLLLELEAHRNQNVWVEDEEVKGELSISDLIENENPRVRVQKQILPGKHPEVACPDPARSVAESVPRAPTVDEAEAPKYERGCRRHPFDVVIERGARKNLNLVTWFVAKVEERDSGGAEDGCSRGGPERHPLAPAY